MTFSVVRTLPCHDPRLGAVRSFAELLDAEARARLQVWIYDASQTVHMFGSGRARLALRLIPRLEMVAGDGDGVAGGGPDVSVA